jgi:predicted dehydrogenase
MNTSVGQPVEICGKEAMLRFDGIAHDVTTFTITPESFVQGDRIPREYREGQTPAQPSHMQDFFDCVRSRGVPKCGVEEAFIETATFLMSVEAYRQRRQVRWDATREDIV